MDPCEHDCALHDGVVLAHVTPFLHVRGVQLGGDQVIALVVYAGKKTVSPTE